MLWHASTEAQRPMPCGAVGVAIVGRPFDTTVSEKLTLGRRRA